MWWHTRFRFIWWWKTRFHFIHQTLSFFGYKTQEYKRMRLLEEAREDARRDAAQKVIDLCMGNKAMTPSELAETERAAKNYFDPTF